MTDAYNYTYLNSKKYLKLFRWYLKSPSLDRALLTRFLKMFNKRMGWNGFIRFDWIEMKNGRKVKVERYNKEMLDNILGVNADGLQVVKPENNPLLMALKKMVFPMQNRWNGVKEEEPDPYEDMPEADMEKVSQMYIDKDNLGESRKRNKSKIMKKNRISESRLNAIMAESIRNVLKEDKIPYGTVVPPMSGPAHQPNHTFRGVEGTELIWHGEWADPEIRWNGSLYNYYEIEDTLVEMCREEGGNPENDEEFNRFCQEHAVEVFQETAPVEEEEEE